MMIIHATIGLGGGVGTVIKNLVNYQLQQDCKVGIIYLQDEGTDYKDLAKDFSDKVLLFPQIVNIRKGNTIIKGLPIKKIYKELKNKYPNDDIIFHAHNLASIGLMSNIDNIPIVCTIHGINSNSSYISKLFSRFILKKAIMKNVKMIGVSNRTSEYYSNMVKKGNIETIRNGVKINPLKSPFKFDKFTIGFVAYIDDFKGWKYLFDAYNLLDDNYKNQINLVFAGPGKKEDILRLQELIKLNNLTQHIYYLGEVYNAGNTLTPNLNLVVLPSLNEGLPMTLLESIGNGVPILATNVGGIEEVLNDGVNGFFITRNPNIIADCIRKIFNNRVLYNELRNNCIEMYMKEFTVEKMGTKYGEIYNNLLEGIAKI